MHFALQDSALGQTLNKEPAWCVQFPESSPVITDYSLLSREQDSFPCLQVPLLLLPPCQGKMQPWRERLLAAGHTILQDSCHGGPASPVPMMERGILLSGTSQPCSHPSSALASCGRGLRKGLQLREAINSAPF